MRCPWAEVDDLYIKYHDTEWGVPVHEDKKWFEFLVLEGAQAGLSWLTVLKKRESYREAFAGFDPRIVAKFDENEIEKLMADSGIIRNRRKLESAINNAREFLQIEVEFGSFDKFIWSFVDYKQVVNAWTSLSEIPAVSKKAHQISHALKEKGFSFVGPTIVYALMQAAGLVNDHLVYCFRYTEV
ncbi:MAG: DNA-3-methyladenine glycosylase I [Kosmotogaceae bacterium]|nr:DNA-3-methyladenine glycosylase I [Kosmotogaceae bacterium]